MTHHIADELRDCEVIDNRNGSVTDLSGSVVAPQVWIEFLNRDEEFDVHDIQVEGEGWDLIDLPFEGVCGPVSQVHMVHESMVEHIAANPGVYALVSVQGIMPEWVFAGSDREIGWALAKRG